MVGLFDHTTMTRRSVYQSPPTPPDSVFANATATTTTRPQILHASCATLRPVVRYYCCPRLNPRRFCRSPRDVSVVIVVPLSLFVRSRATAPPVRRISVQRRYWCGTLFRLPFVRRLLARQRFGRVKRNSNGHTHTHSPYRSRHEHTHVHPEPQRIRWVPSRKRGAGVRRHVFRRREMTTRSLCSFEFGHPCSVRLRFRRPPSTESRGRRYLTADRSTTYRFPRLRYVLRFYMCMCTIRDTNVKQPSRSSFRSDKKTVRFRQFPVYLPTQIRRHYYYTYSRSFVLHRYSSPTRCKVYVNLSFRI